MDSTLENRLQLPHAVSAVIHRQGRIVATRRRTSDLWGYPGGKIDAGESPLQALARETAEETGLVLLVESCKCFYEGACLSIDPADKPYWVYAFSCEISSDSELVAMPGEPEARWMTPQEFLRLSAFPQFNRTTQSLLGLI